MDKNVNERYKNVYQTMNQALKYYKKYSQQDALDQDEAIREGNVMVASSELPEFTRDLLFAVQDQLGREMKQ